MLIRDLRYLPKMNLKIPDGLIKAFLTEEFRDGWNVLERPDQRDHKVDEVPLASTVRNRLPLAFTLALAVR